MKAKPLTSQRGAESIEFALFTLPVLLLLTVVFVEFGFAFADKAVIIDASRAAAREAIRGGTDLEARGKANAVLKSRALWGAGPYTCNRDKCLIVPTGDRSTGTPATEPGVPVTATLTFPFQFRILPPLSDIKILSFLPDIKDVQLSGETVMRMLPH